MKNLILGAALTILGVGFYHAVYKQDASLILALLLCAFFVVRDVFYSVYPTQGKSKEQCNDCKKKIAELEKIIQSLEQQLRRTRFLNKK